MAIIIIIISIFCGFFNIPDILVNPDITKIPVILSVPKFSVNTKLLTNFIFAYFSASLRLIGDPVR